ncbi:MAG: superinfection immunity protein [Asticcacaulis sp.]|uniref:superinfection immunity protein n=1 Tax=Asticcacaulis sp. TaxID=1872648 RepID=UPI0039E61115
MKSRLVSAVILAAAMPSLAMAQPADGNQSLHILLVSFFFVPVIYFVPAIIAGSKDHPQPGAVFWLNLLLGWTLVGWCVSLLWALEKGRPRTSAPL